MKRLRYRRQNSQMRMTYVDEQRTRVPKKWKGVDKKTSLGHTGTSSSRIPYERSKKGPWERATTLFCQDPSFVSGQRLITTRITYPQPTSYGSVELHILLIFLSSRMISWLFTLAFFDVPISTWSLEEVVMDSLHVMELPCVDILDFESQKNSVIVQSIRYF